MPSFALPDANDAGNTPQCQTLASSSSSLCRLFQSARAAGVPLASMAACMESVPRMSDSQAQGTPSSPRRLMVAQLHTP